jgi:hypothetical protein
MEMFIEFKHGDETDPFPSEGLFPSTSSNPTLNRILFNLTRQHGHQFRTWTFVVGIFGKVARLFRCDRSGSQITAGIDYSTEEGNSQLTQFFLRLDQLTGDPEARGWDPTVDYATVEEAESFAQVVRTVCEGKPDLGRRMTRGRKKKVASGLGAHHMFRRLVGSVGDPSHYPRRKMSVMDGEVERDYIVGSPSWFPKALVGRATRGFVAMSVDTKDLVFVKESWRIDSAGVPPEDHWYKRLLSNKSRGGMKKIGAYSCGSDVYATKRIVGCSDMKQRTITHLFANKSARRPIMGYIHYRIVYSELYVPLYMFRDSKHLTAIMLDIALGALFTLHLTYFLSS